MENITTHYDTLQVKDNASQEVIKGAYRYLSQKWHPDKNPHNEEESEIILKAINQAYAVLSDPAKRKAHDVWIETQRNSADVQFNQSAAPASSASRSPEPPPVPPAAQYASARYPPSGSIFGNIKKVAKVIGFFVLLIIIGIAAKVAGEVSSRSSTVEKSFRSVSPDTRLGPAAVQRKTYTSDREGKAQGLKISFKYPATWAGEDGERDHTLYQIASENGEGMEVCNLQIRNMPLTQAEVDNLFDPSSLRRFLPTSGADFAGGGRTTLDGQPGAWIHFWKDMNRGGIKIQTASVVFPVYYNERLIMLGCSVAVSEYASRDDLGDAFSSNLPLFEEIANSLIIHNRRESTD